MGRTQKLDEHARRRHGRDDLAAALVRTFGGRGVGSGNDCILYHVHLSRALGCIGTQGNLQNPGAGFKRLVYDPRRTYLIMPIGTVCRSEYMHVTQTRRVVYVCIWMPVRSLYMHWVRSTRMNKMLCIPFVRMDPRLRLVLVSAHQFSCVRSRALELTLPVYCLRR